MESIKAEQFIDDCNQSEDAETRARGRNVEIAMGGIRSRVEIVMEGGPKNALAFVHANHDNVAYLSFAVTNDKDTTKHALLHEEDHNQLKFWDLPVTSDFTTDHADILAEGCGFSLLNGAENVSLMEGFHEMLTIQKDGTDDEVAYNQQEVPAAQKLEKLGQQVLGVSLFDIYKSGNHQLMSATLKRLADRCLLLKAASEIKNSNDRLLVEAQIGQTDSTISSAENAGEIVDSLQAEVTLEKMLGYNPANNTSNLRAA